MKPRVVDQQYATAVAEIKTALAAAEKLLVARVKALPRLEEFYEFSVALRDGVTLELSNWTEDDDKYLLSIRHKYAFGSSSTGLLGAAVDELLLASKALPLLEEQLGWTESAMRKFVLALSVEAKEYVESLKQRTEKILQPGGDSNE
jgi:hypothetical protein